jgi:16S rRNA (cytosine967-C5)-methyltransferase
VSDSADRQLAARLLVRVEDGAYSSRLLAGQLPAGVRARVLGVLRWQRTLDAALGTHLRRPLDRLDPAVRAVLRAALFEAAVLGVPAAVATDAAVGTVRRLGISSAAGLVNAVLRRAAPTWAALLERASPDLRLSHPEWLYRRWLRAHGEDEAERAMAADQEPAPVWVWWRDEAARDDAAASGIDLEPHPWCPGAWSAPEHARELLAAVANGEAYVQDPSSQLVAHLALRLGGAGARLTDVCAAPGGKLALWRRLGGATRPLALDRHLGRLRLAGRLLDRVGSAELVVADAAAPPLRPGSRDLVLVDAPCSGTGTLRRHPELKWRLQPAGIVELSALQSRILAGACELAAIGGAVLYTTCSIEPEENEALLDPQPAGFEAVDLAPLLPPGVPSVTTAAGGIRLLPGVDGDGFTMHAVRRRG